MTKQIVVAHITLTAEGRNPIGSLAQLNTRICVGFGEAKIYKDGKVIYDGEREENENKVKKLSYFEKKAKQEPGDWRLVLRAPMWNATWQRQGEGRWVCIETGMGFA